MIITLWSFALLTACGGDEGGTAGSSDSTTAKYPTSEAIISMPTPPMGQRWVLNADVSDEFSGNELDLTKWKAAYINGWKGRVPGLYSADNVHVNNGMLELHAGRIEPAIDPGNGYDYNVSCGVVSSLNRSGMGYYECRMKPHKTPLAAAIWLMYDGSFIPNEAGVTQPSGFPNSGFQQEIDILETVGRKWQAGDGYVQSNGKPTSNWNWFNSFSETMNYNVHAWGEVPNGYKVDYDIFPPQDKPKPADGSLLSESFHTYSVLWVEKDCAEFFFDGVSNGVSEFFSRASSYSGKFWMSEPMNVVLDIETYDWGIPPTTAELNDPAKNRSLYDYFRHYVLVDVDEADVSSQVNSGAMPWLGAKIYLPTKRETIEQSSSVMFDINYSSSSNRKASLVIYNSKGEVVTRKSQDIYAGYGATTVSMDFSALQHSEKYTVVAYLINSADGEENHLAGDSYEFRLN